jgi:xanthine dehydrogenase accessory factor
MGTDGAGAALGLPNHAISRPAAKGTQGTSAVPAGAWQRLDKAVSMRGAINVLQFLNDAHRRGDRTALIAIARVIGSSSRDPGTLMAVSESGACCGSLSGGCVEAAVVGEAQRVIAQGRPELLRLGAGSPLIDIRLPCGGGLDLLIVPAPNASAVARAVELLDQRRTVQVTTGLDGTFAALSAEPIKHAEWDGSRLALRIDPALRIVAIGQGEEVIALSRQALAYGADVTALTPDAAAVDLLERMGAKAHHLLTPAPSPLLQTDATTAVVFLFHDHDWEQALLRQALDLPALLIGAMGSQRTQALRLEALRNAGIPKPQRERIEGPIGLIPMTRDPDTLALSVLAQVAARHQAHNDRLCDPAGNRTVDQSLGTQVAT